MSKPNHHQRKEALSLLSLVGSLIDTKERQRLLDLIDDSVKRGCKLVYGGTIPEYLPEELKGGAFFL